MCAVVKQSHELKHFCGISCSNHVTDVVYYTEELFAHGADRLIFFISGRIRLTAYFVEHCVPMCPNICQLEQSLCA